MNTDLLVELCSVPTAPFVEKYVVQYVERFIKQRRRLRLSRDAWGNLLIELPAKGGTRSPRWVFCAHMDHPAFVAREMVDSTTLKADFYGGVYADFFRGAKVRFFDGIDGEQEIAGVVTDIEVAGDRKDMPSGGTIKVKGPVAPGTAGMFDVGAGRIKGGKFYSRVCDDLAGAAACLALLDELSRAPAKVPVAVLLTRAEEEGFIGAIAAATKPTLLKKTDRIVAIECSAAQPFAPQGGGAIIRVGDRTSVFHSDLSYFITSQAEALAKTDKSLKHQRALMPGGTCEATVYGAYGFTDASICVALGNYHNMDRATQKISAEYIDLNDWKSMVKLFVQVARTGHEYEPGMKPLKERLRKRFDKFKGLLR